MGKNRIQFVKVSTEAGPASLGKRVLLLALGVIAVVAAVFIPSIPAEDTFYRVCQWAVTALFFGAGLQLLYFGARGNRKQVDKAVQSVLDGL